MTKARLVKISRNIAISTLVILGVLLGGGTLYTWYMGQYGPKAPVTSFTTDTAVPVVRHVKPASNVAESASVQMLTSPVAPGSNAAITVKTKPDSECTITVVYDKVPSKDSGLQTKTADDFGVVNWSWTVEPAVPIGKWPVTITCTENKKSAVVIGDLVIAK